MSRFQAQTDVLLDEELTEEERMLRDSARDFCQEKLMPRVLLANRHERFDRQIMDGNDRHIQPQRLPVFSVIERNVNSRLRSRI